MNDYFDRIIINWLASYSSNFVDDMVLRAIVSNFESNPHHEKWIAHFNKINKKYMDRPDRNEYAAPRDFLTRADISKMTALAAKDRPQITMSSGTMVMAEVLELTDTEQMMLDFAIRLENCSYTYRECLDNFRFNEANKQTDELYSILFEMPADDIRKAREGFLFSSGLLNFGDSVKTYPQLSSDMADILTKEDLTVEGLAAELFPNGMTTKLTVDNYAYLVSEISLCESVINNAITQHTKGVNVMFWGQPGAGKSELALVLAKKNDWNLIVVGDYGVSHGDTEKSRAQRLTSLRVALKLYGGSADRTVIMFDEMEDLFKTDTNAAFSKAYINRVLEGAACPIIWTTNELELLGQPALRRMSANIAFDGLPEEAALVTWKHYRDEYGVALTDEQIAEFAADFKISPALIANSIKIAKASGATGDDLTKVVTSLERLVNFGAKRKPEIKARGDIPYDISYINSSTNMERLAQQMVKSSGAFTCCLYGESGTGKTEFARHIAKLMNRKVLVKRPSDILAPYVGQNEENLREAFEQARRDKRVLVFDEGDTFLRPRRDARQSWEANLTNEFLQCLESHPNPVFVTTNMLVRDLDPAMLRRFVFKAEFLFLSSAQVGKMFLAYFGMSAPSEIYRLQNLAPGDFDVVHKKMKILELTDVNEISEMLIDECSHKDSRSTKIGF